MSTPRGSAAGGSTTGRQPGSGDSPRAEPTGAGAPTEPIPKATASAGARPGKDEPPPGSAENRETHAVPSPVSGTPSPDDPRKVKLTIMRVDPWTVFKTSFLLSVALGIAAVVAAIVLWLMLSGMGVFDAINESLTELQSTTNQANRFNVSDYLGFSRVISASVVISVINVVLLTAIATVTAFIYNLCASLVGGIGVTLSDE